MTEISRATILGTGTMGPGMGAVLARAGIQVSMYDVSAEALERAKGGVEIAKGVLDRLEAPKPEGGGVSFEPDLAAALEGTEVVADDVDDDRHADLARQFERRLDEVRGQRQRQQLVLRAEIAALQPPDVLRV